MQLLCGQLAVELEGLLVLFRQFLSGKKKKRKKKQKRKRERERRRRRTMAIKVATLFFFFLSSFFPQFLQHQGDPSRGLWPLEPLPANGPGGGEFGDDLLLGVEEIRVHVDDHLVLVNRDLQVGRVHLADGCDGSLGLLEVLGLDLGDDSP